MKTIVVCSAGEWQVCGEKVLAAAEAEGVELSGIFFHKGSVPGEPKLPLISRERFAECGGIVFLSIYDLSAAAMVYRTGIRQVKVFHTDGYFVERSGDAQDQESVYINSRNFRSLKELNRIRMLLSYFHREPVLNSYPLEIQIESTSFCNAQCIMCGHFVYKNAIAKHIPAKLTHDLEKYLMYAENVILHGNGEPFLQPDIKEMIRFYGSYGIKLLTNTNLSVLDMELISLIKEHFREMTVSIDGCTKEVYENIRLNLSFDKLLENLRLINRYAPEIPKTIAVVASRQNIMQLPDFVSFASENGFSRIDVIEMGSSPVAGNEFDELKNFPAAASRQLKKTAALAKQKGIGIELPFHLLLPGEEDEQQIRREIGEMQSSPMFPGKERSRELFESLVRPRLEELCSEGRENVCFSDHTSSPLKMEEVSAVTDSRCCGVCDSLLKRPFVMLEGKFSTCCLRPKHYLGVITDEDSLGQLWNSPQIIELRKHFYNGSVPEYCKGCSFMNNHFLDLLSVSEEDDHEKV